MVHTVRSSETGNMELGSYKDSVNLPDPQMNLQQHQQQHVRAVRKHQQPQCQFQAQGSDRCSAQQQQLSQKLHQATEHVLQLQQQHLAQLPVGEQQSASLSAHVHKDQAQQQHAGLNSQQLRRNSEQPSQWKECARCSLRFPLDLLQGHLADCFSSINMKPNGDLDVASSAMFICGVCEKVCPNLASLREHNKSHSVENTAASKNRTVEGPTADDNCVHVSGTWDPAAGKFMCSPYKVVFPTCPDLHKHIETHQSEAPSICQICGKLFQQLGHLLQHMDTHEHIKACPCGQVFARKQEFRDHQEFCLPVVRDLTAAPASAQSYRCRLCPKVFGTVQSRLQHERVHKRVAAPGTFGDTPLAKKPLICDLCKQEFTFKENYRAHMRSHTGEKPYNCRHCPKNFSSLQGRWQHERIHKREINKF